METFVQCLRHIHRRIVVTSMKSKGKKMAKGIPVDTDPDPSPNPGARRLRKYWTRGEGALKIKWGTPGQFDRCVRELREHVGAGAEGLCAVYYKDVNGHWPGKGHKSLDSLFMQSDGVKSALIDVLAELETKASPANTMRAMDTGVSAGARNRAMNESRARMNRNDANARAEAQKKNNTKQRRIRTQAGAKRYKGNIGDVITTKKVEKGDTLWDMAKAQYGDPNKWKLIAEANGIKDPKKLPIGKELVFPPDPDNPRGNAQNKPNSRSSSGRAQNTTGKGKEKTAGEQRAEDARKDHSTYSDGDSVDLEATYYAPKNMSIEDVLRKFYGNTDRLDDVLKVNGLDRSDDILAGQSLILPGIDPSEIYPDKKKRENAKKTADAKRQGKVPDSSPGGAKAKATARGYTLYSDGSIYGADGWIVNTTKKKAEARRKAKNGK